MTADDWQRLPPKTRAAIVWLVRRYGQGYTGRVVLEALNGSVEIIEPTERIDTHRLMPQD
jgi:hypothetical protein